MFTVRWLQPVVQLQGRRRVATALQQVLNSQSRNQSGASTLPVLTFFTKRNEPCSLCDQAKEVLEKYKAQICAGDEGGKHGLCWRPCPQHGNCAGDKFTYEERYIDDPANAEWFDKYKFDIPVIHLNDQFLMKHRVNEEVLKRALRNF